MAGVGVNLTMKVIGLDQAGVKINAAKHEVENTKPLMNKAIIILENSHSKTFNMQGRPRWKPSERAASQGGKTLQDTTRLKQSVTARSPASVRKFGKKTLIFGTKIIYAPTHQFGMPARGIPKRPFLGVYNEDIKKMEQVFKNDLEGRIRVVIDSA